MKVHVKLHNGRTAICTQPYEGSDHVLAAGLQCGCSRDLTLQLAGGVTTEHDGGRTVTAPAYCTRCHGHVGKLVVKLGTLFGPDEDRRVLQGRCRVY